MIYAVGETFSSHVIHVVFVKGKKNLAGCLPVWYVHVLIG